jgi:hypothetical protein
MTREQGPAWPPGARPAAAGGDISTSAASEEPERPGDPVCLLRRVCPACGSVASEDPPTSCPQCHTEITGT